MCSFVGADSINCKRNKIVFDEYKVNSLVKYDLVAGMIIIFVLIDKTHPKCEQHVEQPCTECDEMTVREVLVVVQIMCEINHCQHNTTIWSIQHYTRVFFGLNECTKYHNINNCNNNIH